MNEDETHSCSASADASPVYDLGDHVLEFMSHEGMELSSQSVSIHLTEDEAYRLSLLLHLHFS